MPAPGADNKLVLRKRSPVRYGGKKNVTCATTRHTTELIQRKGLSSRRGSKEWWSDGGPEERHFIQVMMPTYVLEEVANALNDRFVAAGHDRVVRKEANTELTVSEKIDI